MRTRKTPGDLVGDRLCREFRDVPRRILAVLGDRGVLRCDCQRDLPFAGDPNGWADLVPGKWVPEMWRKDLGCILQTLKKNLAKCKALCPHSSIFWPL